jgi:hypothetical protein
MVELFERALRASGKRFGVTAFARKAGSLFPVGARLVREWERVRRHHIRPQGGLLRRAGRTFARKSEDVCRHRIRPRGGLLRTLLERALRANWKRFGVTAFARKAGSLYLEFGSEAIRYGIGGPRGESACSLRLRPCPVERFPRLDCQCRRVSKTSSLQHKVGRQAWKVRGTGVHFNHSEEEEQ